MTDTTTTPITVDPNVIHLALEDWVNRLDSEFRLDQEAADFAAAMSEALPEHWAAWLEAVSVALVTQHMRSKINLRLRNARKAAILGTHLARAGKEVPGSISGASLFASQAVSIQTGDGQYAALRRLTKLDLLRVAKSHETMIKGHLRSASLFRRLAALLPTDDAVLGDFVTDEKIAEVAADAEEVVG